MKSKRDKKKELLRMCAQLKYDMDACSEAVNWLRRFDSVQQAWLNLDDADYLDYVAHCEPPGGDFSEQYTECCNSAFVDRVVDLGRVVYLVRCKFPWAPSLHIRATINSLYEPFGYFKFHERPKVRWP